MSSLPKYQNKYRNIKVTRCEKGVLTLALHTDDGPLKWGALAGSIHSQLGEIFRDIAHDRENRIVILTGVGDSFCIEVADGESPPMTAENWSRIMREGRELLTNFLDIEVPVIGILNGTASIHAEIPLLGDVVLASDEAVVSDAAHVFAGIVPGDGVQVLWLEWLGLNRGRHFLLTGSEISSEELLREGVVAEVLPKDQLMPRAKELAAKLVELPPQTARYTRLALTQRVKKRLLEELGYGLALEGLSIAALMESVQESGR